MTPKKQTLDSIKNFYPVIISLVVGIILWQIIAEFIVKNPFILPSFTDVIASLMDLLETGVLVTDIYISLVHFVIGLGLSLLIGIPIGIVMGWFETIDKYLNPIIEIIRPIPPLAWIPFAIIWFGLTDFSAGFVIFIGAVFPIIVNTYEGFKNIPKVFVEAGKMLGCTTSLSLIRYVALPATLPQLCAGFRVAVGIAWMCLVAGEMFGVSKYGLGQKIWWFYSLHQMDTVLVYMLVLGLIGLLLDFLFRAAMSKTFLKWHEGEVH